MQKEIQSKSVEIENIEMNQDFYQIMENNKNLTPFMQLFWEQQKLHAKNNPNTIKYHPISGSAFPLQQSQHLLMMNCGIQEF